tara:strand:+ start:509 stop:802 length:294 start_codon:yes stop_codon:yes gene_type:complete
MSVKANVGDLISYAVLSEGAIASAPSKWRGKPDIVMYGIIINAESHNVVAATDIADMYSAVFYDVYFFDGMVTTINEVDFDIGFAKIVSRAIANEEE